VVTVTDPADVERSSTESRVMSTSATVPEIVNVDVALPLTEADPRAVAVSVPAAALTVAFTWPTVQDELSRAKAPSEIDVDWSPDALEGPLIVGYDGVVPADVITTCDDDVSASVPGVVKVIPEPDICAFRFPAEHP